MDVNHQTEDEWTDTDSDSELFPDEVEYSYLEYPDEAVSQLRHPWGSSQGTHSVSAAAAFALSLLNGPEYIFKDVCRLSKVHFYLLLEWLRLNTDFEDDDQFRTREQKLMVFLYIMGFAETQRNAAHFFLISQRSVGRIFHKVLSYMSSLHQAFVKMPADDYVSDKISTNGKYLAFNGCIGAIDGTHVAAYVPLALQRRFRSRKGGISQNIFAAVTFGGRFVYVLAGAEGSIGDASLIRIASSRNFNIPRGRFFIGDAGFGNTRRGVVCPYANVRYHLQEYSELGLRPTTPEELYNLRHSSIRVIVEKAFGMVKRRWKILRNNPPEYSTRDKTRMVFAATAMHNFILMNGLEPEAYIEQEEEGLSAYEKHIRKESLEMADEAIGENIGKDIREGIAQSVWADYARFWANVMVDEEL